MHQPSKAEVRALFRVSDIAAHLAAFVQAEAGRRYTFRTVNCGLLIADWVWSRTGSDPFEPWRDYAADPRNFKTVERRFPRLVERAARRAELPFTRDPQTGDIALVPILGRPVGAIRSGEFWIMRFETGIASMRAGKATLIGAWRVP